MAQLREQLEPHSPKLIGALLRALDDPDGRVRLEAVKLGWAYLFGKPVEVLLQGHNGARVDYAERVHRQGLPVLTRLSRPLR